MLFGLLALLLLSAPAHALYRPQPVRTFPTSGYHGNIALTPSGEAKAQAVARGAFLSSVVAYSTTAAVGAYVPVRLFFDGLEAQVYYRLTSYYGPTGLGSWPVTYEFNNLGRTYERRQGGGTAYRSVAVVSGEDRTGTCYTSEVLYGVVGGKPPAGYFPTGRTYKWWNFDKLKLNYGSGFCTPVDYRGTSELWSVLFSPMSVTISPTALTSLPVGAKVLTAGASVSGLQGAFVYPAPESNGTPVEVGAPTGADLYPGSELNDYYAAGGLALAPSDVTTFTPTGPSGYAATGGAETTTEGSTTTINVDVSVDVNMPPVDLSPVTDRLDVIIDTLTARGGSTPNPQAFAQDMVGGFSLPSTFGDLAAKFDSVTKRTTSYDFSTACHSIDYLGRTLTFCWAEVPGFIEALGVLRFFILFMGFYVAYTLVMFK